MVIEREIHLGNGLQVFKQRFYRNSHFLKSIMNLGDAMNFTYWNHGHPRGIEESLYLYYNRFEHYFWWGNHLPPTNGLLYFICENIEK